LIACTCNVISDHQVRWGLAERTARHTSEVYKCLNCSAECARCARAIGDIMDEAVPSCRAGNRARSDWSLPAPPKQLRGRQAGDPRPDFRAVESAIPARMRKVYTQKVPGNPGDGPDPGEVVGSEPCQSQLCLPGSPGSLSRHPLASTMLQQTPASIILKTSKIRWSLFPQMALAFFAASTDALQGTVRTQSSQSSPIAFDEGLRC